MSKRRSLGEVGGSEAKSNKPNEPEPEMEAELNNSFRNLQIDILENQLDKDELLEIEINANLNSERIQIEIATKTDRKTKIYSQSSNGPEYKEQSMLETFDFFNKCHDQDKCIDVIKMCLSNGCKHFLEVFISAAKNSNLTTDELYVEHPRTLTGVSSILESVEYNKKATFEVLEANQEGRY